MQSESYSEGVGTVTHLLFLSGVLHKEHLSIATLANLLDSSVGL